MTTFRFSLVICLNAALLVSCDRQPRGATTPPERVTADFIKVERNGKELDFRKMLISYGENPNTVDDATLSGKFAVTGSIAKLALYDPYRDILGEEPKRAVKEEYFIPLRAADPAFEVASGSPLSVSVSLKDFSRKKAATLKVGERITVRCDKMRVVASDNLTFDSCELDKGSR